MRDVKILKAGVDVVVGTPGRLKDLLDKGWLQLGQVRHLVLDEADQMLDMGFQDEIGAIFQSLQGVGGNAGGGSSSSSGAAAQVQVQVLLFSATMPQWCLDIARRYMRADREYVDQVRGGVAWGRGGG